MTTSTSTGDPIRDDLLEALAKHRDLFRVTAAGLTEDQARLTPTASSLGVGGLVKHVTSVEAEWARFVVDGPVDMPEVDWEHIDWTNPPPEAVAYAEGFRMRDDETLEGLLAAYDEQAARTDELVRTVELGARQPLPAAPWFEPGASWSALRVFVHVVAETAQHAGHADIIRETIDGQKSMG
ncbi:DinB family protein [Nocardioides litoris]|uniref:DinB family protein n=1 Tax=Nocardioides litoris TaxID=1926648 RepID=UPI0011211A13|nr:DinB family protein [Nocardioides litoris]